MKLASGLLAPLPCIADDPGTTLVQFRITVDKLGDTELLDSAAASPGRYVGEMLKRLRRMLPAAAACLVFNPRLEIATPVVDEVLACIRGADISGDACCVLAHGGVPIAYLVRAEEIDACPALHFGLLTTDDVAIDARYLSASFGAARQIEVPLRGPLPPEGNGFTLHRNSALHAPTIWATDELLRETTPEGRQKLIAQGDRVAVLGFHAGDILFLLQALSLEQTPFRCVIVPPDYADIVSYLRPDLLCRVVEHPVPHRAGYHVTDEPALLRDFIEQLLRQGVYCGHFFHIVRPFFRRYAASRNHLREQIAFALGGSGHPLRKLPRLSDASERDYALMRPQPGRVIVQFDAGWELKEFPRDQRGEFLDLLIEAGYSPVILGHPEPSSPSVPAVPYTDLAGFRLLLGSAEALIGGDSFPTHFASAYGVPTVTLFGNTKPANSRGRESLRYRYLQRAMTCIPCDATIGCRVDGGTSCLAFPGASEVLDALRAMVPAPADRLRTDGETAPRPLAECEGLIAHVVPRIEFPGRPPLSTAAQERYLDRLFSQVQLETVAACPLCGSPDLQLVGHRFRLPVACCAGCGLWLVRERIRSDGLAVLYSESYWTDFMRLHGYPTHVERYMFDYMAALERVRDIAALCPPAPGRKTLDIGCSLAALPRRLAEFGYDAAGLELDRDLGRRAALFSGVPVHASLEELKARGERFDVVSMFDVFEHIYDVVPYLESLRAIVATDGFLLFETFRTDSPAFAKEKLQHEDVKPIEHPYMYMQKHIEEILRRAGMRVHTVTYPMGVDHARIRIAARWAPEGAPARGIDSTPEIQP